jgi:hypothetical protein
MSFQRLQDTDMVFLRVFWAAVGHLICQKVTKELQAEAATVCKPFLTRLLANCHPMLVCADLMRYSVGLVPRKL